MEFDDDIWSQVKPHAWKWRRRTEPPTLIELHATRSGIAGRAAAEEYSATINWSLSAGNINATPGDDWASMESYIIGGGKVCRVLSEDAYPHYSLGHADRIAFSIEIGQNLPDTPFESRDLELAAELCAELSAQYDIPVRVLPYLSADNREGGGYVRHDRSANGDRWGKSDPGPLFNDAAFEQLVRAKMAPPPQEEDMLWLIKRKPPSQETYITNGVVKGRVDDPVALGKLRAAGIWPAGTSIVLDDDAIDAIPDA